MFLVATHFIGTNIAVPLTSLVYITIVDKLNYMVLYTPSEFNNIRII
jgi:hypothetical protein